MAEEGTHEATYGGYRCEVCGRQIVIQRVVPNQEVWVHKDDAIPVA